MRLKRQVQSAKSHIRERAGGGKWYIVGTNHKLESSLTSSHYTPCTSSGERWPSNRGGGSIFRIPPRTARMRSLRVQWLGNFTLNSVGSDLSDADQQQAGNLLGKTPPVAKLQASYDDAVVGLRQGNLWPGREEEVDLGLRQGEPLTLFACGRSASHSTRFPTATEIPLNKLSLPNINGFCSENVPELTQGVSSSFQSFHLRGDRLSFTPLTTLAIEQNRSSPNASVVGLYETRSLR